jgi:quercetin 2,3-dioxygenase
VLNIPPARANRSFGRGPFQIHRMRPGTIVSRGNDPAFGPLGVNDHANLGVGTLVRMHEHNNDEILNYMWRGTMVHENSAGHRIAISPCKLMMMNVGKSFFHAGPTPDGTVEMLQIFIRPREAGVPGPGAVQFFDRPDNIVDGQWHLIAGAVNLTLMKASPPSGQSTSSSQCRSGG